MKKVNKAAKKPSEDQKSTLDQERHKN